VAGGKTLPFSDETIDEIFRVTLGLPREIVKLCDISLLSAFMKKRETVLPEDIKSAATELNLSKE
jgi:hypothetical protein